MPPCVYQRRMHWLRGVACHKSSRKTAACHLKFWSACRHAHIVRPSCWTSTFLRHKGELTGYVKRWAKKYIKIKQTRFLNVRRSIGDTICQVVIFRELMILRECPSRTRSSLFQLPASYGALKSYVGKVSRDPCKLLHTMLTRKTSTVATKCWQWVAWLMNHLQSIGNHNSRR